MKEQKCDRGRGFACAGRSKTNDKVAMTFKGQIPGTKVGMSWLKQIQLSECGEEFLYIGSGGRDQDSNRRTNIQSFDQSPCFLNKIIGILENHSESLSFSLSHQEKRGIEKKRETQNDSLECQYIYSKSLGSGVNQE